MGAGGAPGRAAVVQASGRRGAAAGQLRLRQHRQGVALRRGGVGPGDDSAGGRDPHACACFCQCADIRLWPVSAAPSPLAALTFKAVGVAAGQAARCLQYSSPGYCQNWFACRRLTPALAIGSSTNVEQALQPYEITWQPLHNSPAVSHGHGDCVRDVAWPPPHGPARCGSHQQRRWQAAFQKNIHEAFLLFGLPQGHGDWVRDVAWAPNMGLPASTIASCGQDGQVLAWSERPEGGWDRALVTDVGQPAWRVRGLGLHRCAVRM